VSDIKVSSEWFIGIDEDEKEEFYRAILRSRKVLLQLHKLATKRLNEKTVREVSLDAYENPSWAYREADIIGAKRELRYLLALLNPLVPDKGK